MEILRLQFAIPFVQNPEVKGEKDTRHRTTKSDFIVCLRSKKATGRVNAAKVL
jgi:hypothetical protein